MNHHSPATAPDEDAIQFRQKPNAFDHLKRAHTEFPDMAPPAGTVEMVRRKYRAWLKRRGLRPEPFTGFTFGARELEGQQ